MVFNLCIFRRKYYHAFLSIRINYLPNIMYLCQIFFELWRQTQTNTLFSINYCLQVVQPAYFSLKTISSSITWSTTYQIVCTSVKYFLRLTPTDKQTDGQTDRQTVRQTDISDPNVDNLNNKITDVLDAFTAWCDRNKLILNTTKTTYINFYNRKPCPSAKLELQQSK